MENNKDIKKKTILVTGASGLSGSRILSSILQAGYNVIGTAFKNKPADSDIPFPLVNLGDARSAFELINHYQPEIVIHTAANTHLDLCEIYQEQAWISNVIAVKNLVGLGMLFGYRLIFFSSEQVYGEHPEETDSFFSEDDPVSPLNFYGKTKMAAEEIILEHLDDYVIFRMSLVYGWGNQHHISWCDHLYEDIEEGIQVKMYSDQIRSMIFVEDIPQAVLKFLNKPEITGVFNLGSSRPLKRSIFATEFAKIYGFSNDLIIPVTMEEQPPETSRPKNCAMNTSKIQNAIGFKSSELDEALARMKENNPHPPINQKKKNNTK